MTGIIILNYNNAQLTINCVESIIRYTTCPIRIIVVDNASSDNSVMIFNTYLSEKGCVFDLLVADRNGGYAQGNNIGLKYLESMDEITEVMVLNNDILFTEDIIPRLISFLDVHNEAGMICPLLHRKDGSVDNSCARKDCEFGEIIWSFFLYFTDILGILSHYRKNSKIPIDLNKTQITIELPSGSCMMIRKGLFQEIGYFDPNTFLYFEENILYRKLLVKGKINYLLPSISCIHLGGETTNKVSHPAEYMKRSKKSAYYYAKNYRKRNWFRTIILEISYNSFLLEVNLVKIIKGLLKSARVNGKR